VAVETAALERRRIADRPGVAVAVGVVAPVVLVPVAVLAAYDPFSALALAIAVVAAVLLVLRVDLALLLLVAAAPLESAIEISPNPQLTITKVVGAICFASFALFALSSRHRVLLDRTHAIVFLLLALALLSTLQADEISPALTVTIRYASFVALYVVVSQFLGDPTLQRRVAWVLSLASTVAGAQAVYNFLVVEDELVARPSYGDPNDLAFLLATTLPLTLWLLRERGLRRIVVVAMVVAISTSVVLTFSRGALVGLGAAALWHFVTERRHLPVLLAAVLVVAAVAATLARSNPSQFEVGFEAKQDVAGTNVSTRLDAWAVALRLASQQPVLGVGPGNFQYRYPDETERIVSTNTPRVVHNAYLDIAAELGFVGLFLFLAYIAETFARLTAASRRGYGLPGFAVAVRSALVVAMVSALFLSEQYYAPFWLIGGIATGLWLSARAGPGHEPVPATPPASVPA
jgi:O-antigen ligase